MIKLKGQGKCYALNICIPLEYTREALILSMMIFGEVFGR